MPRIATPAKTRSAKAPAKKAVARRAVTAKRPHFAIRAISNRTPKGFRAHKAGHLLSRIFTF